jgi:hypothetical protein
LFIEYAQASNEKKIGDRCRAARSDVFSTSYFILSTFFTAVRCGDWLDGWRRLLPRGIMIVQ